MKLTLVKITPAEQTRIDAQIRKIAARNARHEMSHYAGNHDGKPVRNCPSCK